MEGLMGTLSLKSPEKAAERLKSNLKIIKFRNITPEMEALLTHKNPAGSALRLQKDAGQTAEDWICATFKKTFDPIKPLPLASGIKEAALKLMPAYVNPSELASFLRKWTRQAAYFKALAEPGSMRCDLEGQPIESVKDTHKKWAEEMLLKKKYL